MEVDLHLSAICRLCADNNPNGVLLFDENSTEGDLGSFINMYLPFKVQNDGKLPQTICPGCNIQLQATVQFFELAIEGQKKIREMWKEQIIRRRKLEKEISSGQPSVKSSQAVNNGDEMEGLSQNTLEHSYSQDDTDPSQLLDSEEVLMVGLLKDVEEHINVEVFEENGSMYAPDDPLVLRAEGLERPRKKRGRPKKVPQIEPEIIADSPAEENLDRSQEEAVSKQEDKLEKIDDSDCRKRRKRKVPQRYKEAVQGKELERIFREEGVIDEEEDKEAPPGIVEDKQPTTNLGTGPASEVIGHLETQEGQDLGEVVIVNKNKTRRKYPLRKKVRFQCEICGRGFLHHGRYMFHKSIHKGVKFECTACHKRFSTKDNFELHQKISGHTGEGIIENLDEDIAEGKSTEESKKGVEINCKLCDKTFITKLAYENHLSEDHQNIKPYHCDFCHKGFSHEATLKSHILSHGESSGKEKGYPCNLCGKKLNHPSSVLYHREAEHNNGRRFVCNKCGKSFKHKQLLQRHQLVHSDNRPFQCTLCTASFKTKANLMNHHATHTGEKKHKCEHCGQQFAHKTSLTLHYRWHSGQKPYQCTVCKKMFSQKGNLQEHYRIHTGEKPFACSICSRKFTTSSQFKLHMKRHSGERPWKCEFCSKSFLHKDAWKCHIRRHKGEKPFQCPHCSRDFPEQWALKKHMRLHTGERPYSCTICGKTFADCSNLTKHKKVHAREAKMEEEEQSTVDGVDLTVWNIIQSHLQENAVLDKDTLKPGEDVQQIIYVTYQQDGEESVGVKLKDDEKLILPHLVDDGGEVSLPTESLPLTATQPLQVTDDQGNPIQFTMQDGSALQITTTDGQNLHVTTKDGQLIPVQITTADGQPISTELAPSTPTLDLQNDPAALAGLEFSTPDGQKYKIIPPYMEDPIDHEYLSIA